MADLNRIPGTKRLIRRTYRRLRDIALWRAWWPFIVLLSVFLIAALLGAFERSPAQLAAFSTLLFLAGALIALLRGARRYRRPELGDAVGELDQQSELRPLASLADRPARPETSGVALWRSHEERLTDAVRRMRVPSFAHIWKRIDPLMLRGILPAALATLFVLNWGNVHTRLSQALTPDYGSLLGAEQVRIETWITPPAHTGRAPIFLQDEQSEVRVPRGSVMTFRVQAPSVPKLRVMRGGKRQTEKFAATPDGAFEIEADILGDTTLSVLWWGERKRWSVLASPDDPPTVQFVSMPTLNPNDNTDFSWAASDDFGLAKLELAIKPEGSWRQPDRVPLELGALNPREVQDETSIDLTRNRWAGAMVEVRLVATDGAGQIGLSDPHVFVLPEKLLLQPLAKAIQDIRVTVLREDRAYEDTETEPPLDAVQADGYYLSATQRLSRAPHGVQRGAVMLEAITYDAPRYFTDALVYTGLTTTRYALEASASTDEAKATEPLLWSLALRAEYGSSADAYAALMAARKALEDALRDGASEEEIKRLMEAFKQAAQRYIAAKMAEALANGLEAPPDTRDGAEGEGGGLGGQGFSDMLDALEDLTETGATDQARQLLADITNMLENLEFQQGQGGGDGFPGMPGEAGEGEDSEDLPEDEREMSETMRELSDLLREQRELNDETLAQQRGERGPSQGQDPSAEPGEGDSQAGGSLADRQGELADRLAELAEEMARGGGEAPGEDGSSGLLDEDVLDSIERSQRRAGSALDDGNEGRAIRNQEQATRQLRDLAEGLARDLDEARAARLGDPQQNAGGDTVDPFGNSSTGGIDDSNSVDIPDKAERQRAKDILDELRRRFDNAVDEDEREYLERLLDRF